MCWGTLPILGALDCSPRVGPYLLVFGVILCRDSFGSGNPIVEGLQVIVVLHVLVWRLACLGVGHPFIDMCLSMVA